MSAGRSMLRAGAGALAALFVAVLLAPSVAAQDAGDDVPARVARVALSDGDLYIAPSERAEEWAAVGLNHPIATGDNLWMSGEGRAEIDYGGGQFRLGPDSNVHVSRLDDAQLALFIAQGRVIVRVRALDPGETARIDTPNAQVELQRPGLYRIEVSPEPRQTWVVVREGEAAVMLPGGPQQVLPGQTANIAGAPGAVAEVRAGAGVDGLDTWSAERDRVYERGRETVVYVSRQMVGYADLETQGRWQSYPDYGAVWFPNTVVADWAPYRYGHWVWLARYGWTWVDDASWGYAPFHYGRWANIGGRWGWCPGTFVARPIWAPALVAWYGGSGWSYSASVGGPVFGWIPLGWRDPFVPWWGRCSSRCYDRYNRPYAVNVAERPRQPPTFYANGRVPGAITAVPAAALRDTRPVQVSRIQLPANGLANAPLLAASPAVKPAALSTRVVQPGRGAPQTAGEIATRIRPQALAPYASSAGPGRGVAVPSGGAISGPARSVAPVTAVPPGGAPASGVTRASPGPTAVPPGPARGGIASPAYESPRAPVQTGNSVGNRERMTAPNGANNVAPSSAPVIRQAPVERATRSVVPAPMPPPPAVRAAPQAPVAAVPPAGAQPHAGAPQPQAREAPREAPQQRGQPNGPKDRGN